MYNAVRLSPVRELDTPDLDHGRSVPATCGAIEDDASLDRMLRHSIIQHGTTGDFSVIRNSGSDLRATDLVEAEQREISSPFLEKGNSLDSRAHVEEWGTTHPYRRSLKLSFLSHRLFPEKWRRLPLLWTILTTIVLSVHIVLVYLMPQGSYGLAILASSAECSSLRFTKRYWGLFFNIMATAIYAASNLVMQLLVAPTRANLDLAHARGRSMDIGVPSLQNLQYIGKQRVLLWVLLAFSGLGLHTFYNGLLYVVSPVRQAYEIVVSDDFFKLDSSLDIINLMVNNDLWISEYGDAPPGSPAWESIGIRELQSSLMSLKQHNSAPQWNKSDFSDCFNKSISADYADHPNIVLVLNWTNPSSTNAVLGIADLGDRNYLIPALCPLSFYQNVTSGLEVLNASTFDPPGFWTFEQMETNPEVGVSCTKDPATGYKICSICPTHYRNIPSYDPQAVPFIMYCYKEVVMASACHLAYSTCSLKIITIMLGCKVAGLVLAMLKLRERPVITLGDAIQEYLRSPDEHTADGCLVGDDIVKNSFPPKAAWTTKGWIDYIAWFHEIFYAIAWLIFAIATAITYQQLYDKVPSGKVNKIEAQPTLENDTTWIVKPMLLANSVQILASIRAYFEIGALNHAQAMAEFEGYARVRSGLKVTNEPTGKQRNPGFISQSLHSIVLMQLLSALYAWMLASCLYGEIFYQDFINRPPDLIIPSFDLMVIAQSATGKTLIAFVFILPVIMWLTMPMVSRFGFRGWRLSRHLLAPRYMPRPGFSSLAISVACHPLDEEGNIVAEELQWGVVKQADGSTPGRLAFTKMPVLDMRHEDAYYGAYIPTPSKP